MIEHDLEPGDFTIEKNLSPYKYPLYPLSPGAMASYTYTIIAAGESFTVTLSDDAGLLAYFASLCLADDAPRRPSLWARLTRWLKADAV